jgi:phosphonate transport system ATP-binding protein
MLTAEFTGRPDGWRRGKDQGHSVHERESAAFPLVLECSLMDTLSHSQRNSAGQMLNRSLIIRNLRKEYRAGTPVLNDLSLTIEGRGLTAIIGPSGAGKSTLIRCINRLVEPTSGEILFMGQDLTKLNRRALRHARRRIGMVFQEYDLVERLSVIENVLCGRLGYVAVWRAFLRHFAQADIDHAFRLLDAIGLGDYATERADRLSGGQRQRVGIARALIQEPDLVLADEPTSSLDPKTSVEIMELIARRAGEGDIPVIVNIHNVELARRFADRIVGISKGEVVFDGPPRALEDRHLLAIYGGEAWLD